LASAAGGALSDPTLTRTGELLAAEVAAVLAVAAVAVAVAVAGLLAAALGGVPPRSRNLRWRSSASSRARTTSLSSATVSHSRAQSGPRTQDCLRRVHPLSLLRQLLVPLCEVTVGHLRGALACWRAVENQRTATERAAVIRIGHG
jgi:hypothetical protein